MEPESVVHNSSDLESESDLSIVSKPLSITDLPAELLYETIRYLPLRTIARLCATCRRLKEVLEPELYNQDRKRGIFSTLLWAACTREPEAVATIERALSYWPTGSASSDALHCYFKTRKSYYGKCLEGLTPLLAAVQAANHRAVYTLLSKGVNVHQPATNPETSPEVCHSLLYPIHHAVTMNCVLDGKRPYKTKDKLAVIKLLIGSGADPNQLSMSTPAPGRGAGARLGEIMTPMHLAIVYQADYRVIDLLIKSGAAATRISPPHHALGQRYMAISPISHLLNRYPEATKSHYLAVKSMVANGAGKGDEAQLYTISGAPLLFECLRLPRTSSYSVAITKEILANTSAKADDRTGNGDSAIFYHLQSHILWKPPVPYSRRLVLRHEEAHDMASLAATACDTIDLLLEYGANINDGGSRGITPLHVAGGLHCGYVGIFDHLLKKGANVRATTSNGLTVLHMLLMGDPDANYSLVTHLIKHCQLDRYARDEDGNTFLHHLCTSRVVSLPKWMSEVAKNYKMDDFDNPELRNNFGQTPYEAGAGIFRGARKQSGETKDMLRNLICQAFEEAEKERAAAEERRKERRKERKALERRNNPKKCLPTQSYTEKKA